MYTLDQLLHVATTNPITLDQTKPICQYLVKEDKKFLRANYKRWPGYSGQEGYPIGSGRADFFMQGDRYWTGEQMKQRLLLLQFTINLRNKLETKNFKKVHWAFVENLNVGVDVMQNGKSLMLLETLTIHTDNKRGKPDYFKVPAGLVYDGASIPKVLQPLIGKPTSNRFLVASAVHDYLYNHSRFDKQFADEVFYCHLRGSGVSKSKAMLMYLGVWVFGGFFKK